MFGLAQFEGRGTLSLNICIGTVCKMLEKRFGESGIQRKLKLSRRAEKNSLSFKLLNKKIKKTKKKKQQTNS